jgi:hypothetical protein
VAGAPDSRCAVHVHPDVALIGQQRLARVQTHPHAQRSSRKGLLGLRGGCEGITGACERDEERITLSVDLDPVVPGERLPQHPSMLGQRLGICLSELREQPGGTLDVGEQERDGPRGQLPHGAHCAVNTAGPSVVL